MSELLYETDRDKEAEKFRRAELKARFDMETMGATRADAPRGIRADAPRGIRADAPRGIRAELEEMGAALGQVFELLDRLENRLEPVLIPQPPFGTADSMTPQPQRSEVAETVHNKARDLREIARRLDTIFMRVNV